jgi:RNA methyltransferase, TrmH family
VSPHIDSPSNPRILATARLKQRRQRDRTGRFLVEGTRELQRAVAAGASINEVFVCNAYARPDAGAIVDMLADAGGRITTTTAAAFNKLSQRSTPDGIVAVAEIWETEIRDLSPDLLLVAEAIEKPGNLGAMLRTADAAGAGFVIADPTVDPFNPNVVRASQGALFSAPFAVADSLTAIAWLRDRATVLAATPHASTAYWDTDMIGPTAIVVGSEHGGVGRAWLEVGLPIHIPMAGHADSLNASVAAGLLLFEAVRQRRS